jgi:hypothetical protein
MAARMPEKMARPLALAMTSVGIFFLSEDVLGAYARVGGDGRLGGICTDETFEDVSRFIALLAEVCCVEETHSDR